MGKGGGGGRAGRGGGGGGGGKTGMAATTTWGTGMNSSSVWAQEKGAHGREIMLSVPSGLSHRPYLNSARSFLGSTAEKLNKAKSESAVQSILTQAENYLGGLYNAQVFLGTPPKPPW